MLSEERELALVGDADQFTEVARFPGIEGKTWNHPVLVGNILLVRNGEEMAAFRLSVQPLKKTTSAMKLRVSQMAQSTMTSLRGREDLTPAEAQQLRAEASELCYIKSQPTADEIILRSIGA